MSTKLNYKPFTFDNSALLDMHIVSVTFKAKI